jgi:hypothetical protein
MESESGGTREKHDLSKHKIELVEKLKRRVLSVFERVVSPPPPVPGAKKTKQWTKGGYFITDWCNT